jgi:hypothetical protein
MPFQVPQNLFNNSYIHVASSKKYFEENLKNLSAAYMCKNQADSRKYFDKLDEDLEENFNMNKNFILRYNNYYAYFYNNDGEEDNSNKKMIITYERYDNKIEVGLVSQYEAELTEEEDDGLVLIEKFNFKCVQNCPNQYLNKICSEIVNNFRAIIMGSDFLMIKADPRLMVPFNYYDDKILMMLYEEEAVDALPLTGETFECPISLDEYDTSLSVKTPCGHTFNKENLKQWTEKNKNCPLCRASIN